MLELITMENIAKVAILAASKAAKIIRSSYDGQNRANDKKITDLKDFVTEVDKQVEAEIVQVINENYPDHSIWGEEFGKTTKNSEYTWVIDPIDGTKNFVRHIDQFAISIGIVRNGEPVVGIIYESTNNTYIWAIRNKGVYQGVGAHGKENKKNTKKKINPLPSDVANSSVAVNFGKTARQRERILKVLNGIYKDIPIIRMVGSTAYVVKGMAEGKFDALIDNGDYWDYAAGLVIAKELGFSVTEWNGKQVDEKSDFVLWSKKELYPLLSRVLKSC